MPVNFSDGTVMSSPPRLFVAFDSASGCPPNGTTRGNSTTMISQSVTITRSSVVWVNAKTICSGSGRHDRGLYISGPSGSGYSGGRYAVRLDYKSSSWWEDVYIHWGGTLGTAGTYTFTFVQETGTSYNCGCGSGYGRMNILVMEN